MVSEWLRTLKKSIQVTKLPLRRLKGPGSTDASVMKHPPSYMQYASMIAAKAIEKARNNKIGCITPSSSIDMQETRQIGGTFFCRKGFTRMFRSAKMSPENG